MVVNSNTNEREMEFTGERLVTSVKEYWALEHLHRYALVTNIIKGKCVLDIASGEGYGSFLMARHAKSVIGIDLSDDAINHASAKYKVENLSYKKGSATHIPVPDSTIDVLVSFETLEHHDQHDLMMQEIKRVLKPGGITVISTPDRLNYSDIPGYHNEFHIKELYTGEFKELMGKYFKQTIMLFQKSAVASIIFTDHKSETLEYSGDFSQIKANDHLQDVMYNICFASDSPMEQEKFRFASIFSDKFLTEQYLEAYGKCQELQRELAICQSRKYTYTYKVGKFVLSPVLALNYFVKNLRARK